MIQGQMVYSALNATETTETLIGTITVPTAGVSQIVGCYGVLMQPLATSGETVSGKYRLAIGTTSGQFIYPTTNVAGAAAVGVQQYDPKILPVAIPVNANDTISCYMTANKALTGTGEGFVGVLFQ